MSLTAEQRRQAILSPLPPPTKLEAVATLRFYGEIAGAMKRLVDGDAALGTADCRPAINAALGKLIESGTATVGLLARFLTDVPLDAIAQRHWVTSNHDLAHASARAILHHHTMVYRNESGDRAYHEEHDHLAVLAAFLDRYEGMASA